MITVEQVCSLPNFVACDRSEVEALIAAATERRFSAGTMLCIEGRVATTCYLLIEGSVVVTHAVADTTRELGRRSHGAFIGHRGLIDHKPRGASISAIDAVVALEFDRETVSQLLTAHTPAALLFQEQLAITNIRLLRIATRRLGSILDAHTLARESGLEIDYAATGEDLRAIQLAAREWGSDVLDRADLSSSAMPPPTRRMR
jgi:CRP-like cAMP-binding protein